MSNREARTFLKAICANPQDDTTRLVFADWIEEHGDEPRAEFIRVQVERAALPEWDARHVRLLLRERALLAEHASEWQKELPTVKGVIWGEFRRGFVATAKFDNFAVFKSDADIFEAAPIEAVEVRWPRQRNIPAVPGLRELTIVGQLISPEDLGRLIESPVLSTLRTLTIRGAAIGPDGFRRLLSSPHLKNLTTLHVPFNSVGNQAIDTLVASNNVPNLTDLDLSEPGSYGRYAEDPIINGAGASKLAAWPGLARFRSLAFSGNDLQHEGLAILLRSPHIVGLKRLELRSNTLTGPAMREFENAREGLQLESLDLGENMLGDTGARHLARAACLGELKTLSLERCEMNAPAIRKLASAPFLHGLRVLSVGSNNMGKVGLTALLGAEPAELHTLHAGGCDIGDAGAAKLAESAASDTFLELDLSWNGLGDKGLRALAQSKHLRNLFTLRLAHNHMIGEAGAATLVKSSLGKRLVSLDLPPAFRDLWIPPAGPDDPIPF